MRKYSAIFVLLACILLANRLFIESQTKEPHWIDEVLPCEQRESDVSAVELFEGEVIEILPFTSRQRGIEGLHLRVQTSEEVIQTCFGSVWYLDAQGLTLQPGDVIQIHGSRVNDSGETMVVAIAVGAHGQTLLLRDANGLLWQHHRAYLPDM